MALAINVIFSSPLTFLDHIKNKGEVIAPQNTYIVINGMGGFPGYDDVDSTVENCVKVINLILGNIGKEASAGNLYNGAKLRAYALVDRMYLGGPSGCILQTRPGIQADISLLFQAMVYFNTEELELPHSSVLSFWGVPRMTAHSYTGLFSWFKSAEPEGYEVKLKRSRNAEIGRRCEAQEADREDLLVREGSARILLKPIDDGE